MTVEMLDGFFDIIQNCDGAEAMVLAAAALEQATKCQKSVTLRAPREEFAHWFRKMARTFGPQAVPESGPPKCQAIFDN
jgi:hypothetical protein